ncbi:MAG: N-acetyltransferase, partial [Bacillota bacterium]|nr:N-acetyltransferase [Bacillota bacterium]
KGIGNKILALIINDSERLGIPINLQVLKVNKRAQNLYTKTGFTENGETETHFMMRRNPTTSIKTQA